MDIAAERDLSRRGGRRRSSNGGGSGCTRGGAERRIPKRRSGGDGPRVQRSQEEEDLLARQVKRLQDVMKRRDPGSRSSRPRSPASSPRSSFRPGELNRTGRVPPPVYDRGHLARLARGAGVRASERRAPASDVPRASFTSPGMPASAACSDRPDRDLRCRHTRTRVRSSVIFDVAQSRRGTEDRCVGADRRPAGLAAC